jgi:DeoR/GlpR family transcriptional regulator of sugar metabolism
MPIIQTSTSMMKKERQTLIMKQINLHNRALSSDLSLTLNVSEDTIRRDLNELAEEGKLIKVHGGALSKSYHFNYSTAETYAASAKKIIAHKAASLIQDDMFIMIGGGTTVGELIHQIPTDISATFFTVSLLTALQLCDHVNATVIFIGGTIAKTSQISAGGEVISRLADIHADLCILGANGISFNEGITETDIETVQVKRAMMKASKQTAILTISEKLDTIQRLRVCDLDEVHYLITELDPESADLKAYRRENLTIM